MWCPSPRLSYITVRRKMQSLGKTAKWIALYCTVRSIWGNNLPTSGQNNKYKYIMFLNHFVSYVLGMFRVTQFSNYNIHISWKFVVAKWKLFPCYQENHQRYTVAIQKFNCKMQCCVPCVKHFYCFVWVRCHARRNCKVFPRHFTCCPW